VQNYTYAYDRYGNRVSQTPLQAGYSFNPTINAANNQITTSGYTYDAAGNMTNDTVHSYTYDAEGNITQVDGGSTAQYVYDVFNQRIHVQTASATNEYVYDPMGRRVSTWLSPNNFGSEGRIYWDGRQIGYRSIDGTTYFDHQDMLGTERMRTTYSGTEGSTYTSLPWGDGYTATVNTSGADQDNLHYAGLDRDAESGTEHAQFRNYASVQGRWLAPDPYMGSYDLSNPQSMNRYAYASDNPVSFTDPSGLLECKYPPCEPPVFTLPPITVWGSPITDPAPGNPSCGDLWSCGGNGGGGGGHPGTPSAPSAPNNGIKAKVCSAIPSGRTQGASGGLGGVGSVGGGGELVFNYNSGQVSAFGFGGVQVGWNGGASGSIYTGFVYGLNSSNSNYSGGFTGFNVGDGLGIFGASSSGGLTGVPVDWPLMAQ
jgi:RHS repeat-associated protein